MICPKCNSSNINITSEQTGSYTKGKKAGCLYGIGRLCLIFCTCGLWLIFGKRNKTEKTTTFNQTVAICQNCGNKWVLTD